MMVHHHNKGLNRQQGAVQALLLGKVLAALLCAAWIVHSAFHLADILFPTQHTPESVTASSPSSSSRSTLPTVDITALRSLPLFGEQVLVSSPIIEPEPKEEELVETRLNLTLKGLFTSDSEDVGQAIIANGREERLYHVGDDIEGLSNVTLRAVLSDRIKLDNRGSAEVLYLYPEGERLASAPEPQRNVNTGVDTKPLSDQKKAGLFKDNTNNTTKMNDIIRVVRERDKATGDMLGFRVLPGRDREGFEKSGLQVNDIITSIDGDQLTDLRTAMSIYRDKRDATRVSLILRRGDSEMSVDIDLTELNI